MAKETKKTRAATVAEVRPHALLRQARERLPDGGDPFERERLARILYALGCVLSRGVATKGSAEAALLLGLDKAARAYLRKSGVTEGPGGLAVAERRTFVLALLGRVEEKRVLEGETLGGTLAVLLGVYGRRIFGSGDRAEAEAAADAARELGKDADGVVAAALRGYGVPQASGVVRSARGYSKK